ncbi:hypothetical protein [Streptosporangium lutulentum]|uniref:LPXTG-motif cell wall anchor domain-containing protein n=1 Tax=Streptosporangium lutulentum TaxID=1461250 RepID=A0ABT9QT79_9ACTN|nr:hypothetical protein [Streptosporangium lutulentum]MDP9849956.1 hypothetical protein [Streptosporangium lutulentum]
MKTWLPIGLGVILILMGGLWTLQGLGIVGGSVMSGAGQWIWIGLAVLVVGLLLAVPALLRTRRRS